MNFKIGDRVEIIDFTNKWTSLTKTKKRKRYIGEIHTITKVTCANGKFRYILSGTGDTKWERGMLVHSQKEVNEL